MVTSVQNGTDTSYAPDVLGDLTRNLRSTSLLRATLGLVYFHFGLLKFFPDLSPAEMLAGQTIVRLGFTIDASYILFILGGAECAIGALLLLGVLPKLAAALMLGHLVGTMAPLWVLPELTFKFAPFAPTMEGQYILKNVVFFAAGLMILTEPTTRSPHERPLLAPDPDRSGSPRSTRDDSEAA